MTPMPPTIRRDQGTLTTNGCSVVPAAVVLPAPEPRPPDRPGLRLVLPTIGTCPLRHPHGDASATPNLLLEAAASSAAGMFLVLSSWGEYMSRPCLTDHRSQNKTMLAMTIPPR
jgi:hypothetical protein